MGSSSSARQFVISLLCLVVVPVTSFPQNSAGRQQEIKSHFEQAQAALKAGKADVAVNEFRAVLALDPNNVEARANLGVIAFVQGDYTEAGEHFRQVLKLQPSLWKAEAMLGMCEKRLGKVRSAQALLEKSFPHLQDAKLRTQAGMDLIELDYGQGDILRTVEVLQTLERFDPTNVNIRYIAYRIFSDLAGHALDSVVLTDPDSARMHQIMAQHLVNRGDISGAIVQYQIVIQLDPGLSGAHFELGEAILQNSRSEPARDQAAKEFEAALALNRYDPKSECWLGQIYASKQDLGLALKHYSRALELDPSDVDVRVGLGKVLTAMGRPENALGHLLEAVRLDPQNAVAHYRLSAVYRQLGRTSDAQRESATFAEIRERKKRIVAVYQQMHESPANSQVIDPDFPR
jgi:tetratricopeptide (TPR) repeat protein